MAAIDLRGGGRRRPDPDEDVPSVGYPEQGQPDMRRPATPDLTSPFQAPAPTPQPLVGRQWTFADPAQEAALGPRYDARFAGRTAAYQTPQVRGDEQDIAAAYRQFWGRDPTGPDLDYFRTNKNTLADIQAFLGANPDPTAGGQAAAAPPSQAQQGGYGGGDPWAYFDQLFPGPTLSHDMLVGKRAELEAAGIQLLPNASGRVGKIRMPDGSVWDVVQGGESGLNRKQRLPAGGGGGGFAGGAPLGPASGYTDPSTDLYVNELLSRLESLRRPIEDPLKPLYELLALGRVGQLQQAPFTAGEDAALLAKYRDPLTQARDQAFQRETERTGARGFLPSSGLAGIPRRDIEQGYQEALAGATNEIGVRAIDERQARQRESLDTLANLLGFEQGRRQEEQGREREITQIAGLLPELDERRLGLLLQASGGQGAEQSSLLNSLIALQRSGFEQGQYEDLLGQQSALSWGQLLAQIMAGLTGQAAPRA